MDAAAERARYEKHRNSPGDAGYRAFLDRLLAPLCAELRPGARGLDYGCGPGPTASVMLRERGFESSDYDPYFAPDARLLEGRYDFVCCTEAAEHFRRPAEDFARLDALLKPGGVLGLLTGVLEDEAGFAGWWYRRDPTHVAFYSPRTLEWLAGRFGWTLRRASRDAALFFKI